MAKAQFLPTAGGGGGDPLLGALGSIAGATVGNMIAPGVGGSIGASLGGQLAGQGTIDPTKTAMSAVGSMGGAEGIGADLAKQATGDVAKEAATSAISQDKFNQNVLGGGLGMGALGALAQGNKDPKDLLASGAFGALPALGASFFNQGGMARGPMQGGMSGMPSSSPGSQYGIGGMKRGGTIGGSSSAPAKPTGGNSSGGKGGSKGSAIDRGVAARKGIADKQRKKREMAAAIFRNEGGYVPAGFTEKDWGKLSPQDKVKALQADSEKAIAAKMDYEPSLMGFLNHAPLANSNIRTPKEIVQGKLEAGKGGPLAAALLAKSAGTGAAVHKSDGGQVDINEIALQAAKDVLAAGGSTAAAQAKSDEVLTLLQEQRRLEEEMAQGRTRREAPAPVTKEQAKAPELGLFGKALAALQQNKDKAESMQFNKGGPVEDMNNRMAKGFSHGPLASVEYKKTGGKVSEHYKTNYHNPLAGGPKGGE